MDWDLIKYILTCIFWIKIAFIDLSELILLMWDYIDPIKEEKLIDEDKKNYFLFSVDTFYNLENSDEFIDYLLLFCSKAYYQVNYDKFLELEKISGLPFTHLLDFNNIDLDEIYFKKLKYKNFYDWFSNWEN